MIELTDDETATIEAAMQDPSLIDTIEFAEEVLEQINSDIEQIRGQLLAAQQEAKVCGGLSTHRQEWVKRATGALVWKKRNLKAVEGRLVELGGRLPPDSAGAIRAAMLIKEQELINQRKREKDAAKLRHAEIELQRVAMLAKLKDDKEAARLQRIEAANNRVKDQAGLFVKAARLVLSQDAFVEIWDRARQEFPDHPSWGASK